MMGPDEGTYRGANEKTVVANKLTDRGECDFANEDDVASGIILVGAPHASAGVGSKQST
ncbi:MAG: hypothetical protein Rhob2KO_34400 [Rhodopirellula baltica]